MFAIVSASLFLPVVLETYARQHGVLSIGDRSLPCPDSGSSGDSEADARCIVQLGGAWIDTGALEPLLRGSVAAATG